MGLDHKSLVESKEEKMCRSNSKTDSFYFYGILLLLTIIMFTNLQVIVQIFNPLDQIIKKNDTTKDIGVYQFPTTQKPVQDNYTYESIPICSSNISQHNSTLFETISNQLALYRECCLFENMRFGQFPSSLLLNWAQTQYVCDDMEFVSDLPLRAFENGKGDEKTYWGLTPKCKDNNTMLTLGVKKVRKAEKALKKMIPNLKLFGTNPFSDNSEGYDNVVKVTIGHEADKLLDVKMRNGGGKLITKRRTATDFEKYFESSELKNVKVIDMLFINLENGNFPYWTAFLRNGIFDKLGVTVCQFNIEIARSDSEALKWREFINKMQELKKYVWLRPAVTTDDLVLSTYFLNVMSEYCIHKFVQ